MLTTPDLQSTKSFYEDVLGFECIGVFPEAGDPYWCHLKAGDAHIMFSYDEPHDHGDGIVHGHHPSLSGTLYLYPDDVGDLYGRIKDRVNITMDLMTTDYGMREFRIEDPNGYELSFGQDVS
jgi:catechol 2,3-dioxygenase-like lactoylglutathione lyase family enzyme